MLKLINYSVPMQVTDVNSRDVMELLLITQYFDTLKEIGMSGRSKYEPACLLARPPT